MPIYDYYGVEGDNRLLDYWKNNPDDIGPSPGGAAAKLGVTRKRVQQLADAGFLDLHRVYRHTFQGRPSEMYIGQRSLDEFIERVTVGQIMTRRIKKHLDFNSQDEK